MDEECDDDASCECEGDILYVLPALEAGILPGLCTPKPLASWGSFIKANVPRLCPQCRQTLSNRATAARRATFERLPTLMGVGPLEDWGKKKATKAALNQVRTYRTCSLDLDIRYRVFLLSKLLRTEGAWFHSTL